MREVIITSILYGFDQKKYFFEGWSWFKFNNVGLVLGIAMNLVLGNASVANGLKLKVTKIWGLIRTFIEVTGEKLVGGPFWLHNSE